MKKKQNKDEWKEILEQAKKVAIKQNEKFQSTLTKESRKAISQIEAATRAEILKLTAELEANGKKTIKAILDHLEKDEKISKVSKKRKVAKSVKAKRKKI